MFSFLMLLFCYCYANLPVHNVLYIIVIALFSFYCNEHYFAKDNN